MKKILLLTVVLASFSLGGVLFAQQNAPRFKESEYYYQNVSIEKIFVYRKGYIVLYRKGLAHMARTYIPDEWFNDIGGKGELIMLGSGKEWPSMTVYYRNGDFSHVRLKIRRHRGHESWGIVPLNVNLDEYFEGVEEVQLEF